MADVLDELVGQIAHDIKERHAKMTPEEIKGVLEHESFIITSQRKDGIKNRSRCWTRHKINWVNEMSKREEIWDD